MNTLSQGIHQARIRRSQQYFNFFSLFFYDFILYGVLSKYAWGCSIQRLDAHYKKYVRNNHLEVGVGTGYLLDRVVFKSEKPRLALMDLSQACLEKTKRKILRYAPEIYIQNLLEPIRHAIPSFDSISINYVMHCVPGSFDEKSVAFTHLQAMLNQDGVLFGTSVLSTGVQKNLLAKPLMRMLNVIGIFNKRQDSARDLENFLQNNFEVIEFEVMGVTAVFAVKKSVSRSVYPNAEPIFPGEKMSYE